MDRQIEQGKRKSQHDPPPDTSTSVISPSCVRSTFLDCRGRLGTSHRNRTVAARAPRSWAAMNNGMSTGLIPANVSLSDLAIVTAGFANEDEAVNQYAAVMYAPTAKGTAMDRSFEQPQTMDNKPKVATNSLNNWAGPLRA